MLNNQLDTLQINFQYAWGRFNRLAAIVIGAVILYVLMRMTSKILTPDSVNLYLKQHSILKEGISCQFLAEIVIFGLCLFGGIASPVCKNLVKALREKV